MYLQLAHSTLDVYRCSRELVLEAYKLTRILPEEERYGLIRQIRRASTSVTLNIAEGCSRKSQTERKRFFEIARGSVIEIDSALDLIYDLKYAAIDEMKNLGTLLIRSFKMLSMMLSS